ncbi:dCTP deaminase [Pontixanthobacter sp.]|uniref:dCTP deaminase n=1 Tax=Pontixanthobacter sp. TaxID=2792078 RepID=UPI003C7AD3D4
MILTDREIQIALDQQLIRIDPPPNGDAYSSTSIDLTLGSTISVFSALTDGLYQEVDPGSDGFQPASVIKALTTTQDIDGGGFLLQPGELVLAWTKEKVGLDLKAKIAARVEGKSSLARFGIAVHITAPTIHAGFSGLIQLEVINHGRVPLRLRPGMKFCQLIFEQTLGTPAKGYKGRFYEQDSELFN